MAGSSGISQEVIQRRMHSVEADRHAYGPERVKREFKELDVPAGVICRECKGQIKDGDLIIGGIHVVCHVYREGVVR